jgi:hypothetical protein
LEVPDVDVALPLPGPELRLLGLRPLGFELPRPLSEFERLVSAVARAEFVDAPAAVDAAGVVCFESSRYPTNTIAAMPSGSRSNLLYEAADR